MGTYVNNNKVSIGTAYDYDDAVAEVAGLLAVGTRSDGKYHLADLCQANSINKWAKYKPIRSTTEFKITDDERHSRNYGLKQGSDYFFVYEKPRGGTEWNRILDFDGYNHLAECPMGDTTKFNKTIGVGLGPNAGFNLDPWSILNTGANVEIPLSVLNTFPTSMYVGVLFKNRRTNTGFFHTYEYTLQDVINDASTLYSIEIDVANAPDTLDGDTLDMYYCLGNSANIRYSTNISAATIMCCDATHGHAVVKITSLGYEKLSPNMPTVYCEYTGSNAEFNRVEFVLQVNLRLADYPNAAIPITWRAYVNGSVLGTRSFTLSYGSVGSDDKYTVTIDGQITVRSGALEDLDYEVPMKIEAKFDRDSEWHEFGNGLFNVQSNRIVEWNYVNQ